MPVKTSLDSSLFREFELSTVIGLSHCGSAKNVYVFFPLLPTNVSTLTIFSLFAITLDP